MEANSQFLSEGMVTKFYTNVAIQFFSQVAFEHNNYQPRPIRTQHPETVVVSQLFRLLTTWKFPQDFYHDRANLPVSLKTNVVYWLKANNILHIIKKDLPNRRYVFYFQAFHLGRQNPWRLTGYFRNLCFRNFGSLRQCATFSTKISKCICLVRGYLFNSSPHNTTVTSSMTWLFWKNVFGVENLQVLEMITGICS